MQVLLLPQPHLLTVSMGGWTHLCLIPYQVLPGPPEGGLPEEDNTRAYQGQATSTMAPRGQTTGTLEAQAGRHTDWEWVGGAPTPSHM